MQQTKTTIAIRSLKKRALSIPGQSVRTPHFAYRPERHELYYIPQNGLPIIVDKHSYEADELLRTRFEEELAPYIETSEALVLRVQTQNQEAMDSLNRQYQELQEILEGEGCSIKRSKNHRFFVKLKKNTEENATEEHPPKATDGALGHTLEPVTQIP